MLIHIRKTIFRLFHRIQWTSTFEIPALFTDKLHRQSTPVTAPLSLSTHLQSEHRFPVTQYFVAPPHTAIKKISGANQWRYIRGWLYMFLDFPCLWTVAVKWVEVIFRNREVPSSNTGPQTRQSWRVFRLHCQIPWQHSKLGPQPSPPPPSPPGSSQLIYSLIIFIRRCIILATESIV